MRPDLKVTAAGLTKQLITHLSALKFEDLPSSVIAQARNCVIDFIGTVIAGSEVERARFVREYAASFSHSDESSVFVTRRKASALDAAFANGVTGHLLELDDGNRFAMGHPGVTTIPAALATAEKMKANGKDLILAIVCGYEVFGRLGKAMNPSHFNRGFHTTGTLGTVAAAVAASKILSLTDEKMLNAFGISGSLAAGLSEFLSDGSMTKQIHAGRAAQNGVFASLLASAGLTGPHTLLEGEHGFFKAFSESSAADEEKVTERLGADFQIMNTYFKRHASCRHSHSAIDATLDILSKHKADADAIDEISVKTYSVAYDYTKSRDVRTPLSARMNMPYCVAVTILRGRAGEEEFSEESIMDKKIHRLMSKVEVSVDKELDEQVPKKRGAIVTICVQGRRFSSRVDLPKGEPENPFSKEEFEDKFRSLASSTLTVQRVDDVLKLASNLEEVRNINEFTKMLLV